MHYKRRGNSIQVFAYRGYDAVRRRSIVRYMGSIYCPPNPTQPLSIPHHLVSVLTEDEKEELQAYISTLCSSESITKNLSLEILAAISAAQKKVRDAFGMTFPLASRPILFKAQEEAQNLVAMIRRLIRENQSSESSSLLFDPLPSEQSDRK